MALGRSHAVEDLIWGECAVTADAMLGELGECAAQDQRAELAHRWSLWREEKTRGTADDRGAGLNSANIFAELGARVPEDAVIAVDVGNNTYSFGRYFETRPGQRVLMSGYHGSIGFSFPPAMGAWAATRPAPGYEGRRVISVSGDGGFAQFLAEFTTAWTLFISC